MCSAESRCTSTTAGPPIRSASSCIRWTWSTSSTPGSPLSGHGRPFLDVRGHIEGNRRLVSERLDAVLAAVRDGPKTALEITPTVHGEAVTEANAGWWLSETLCYLHHLERSGRVSRESGGDTALWSAGQP